MTFEVSGSAYDRFMGRYSRPLATRLSSYLEITPGQRVIDVGCGPGAWTEDLVARVGSANVSAIDPSEPFVNACRERFPDVDVNRGSADSLPYGDSEFDVAGACLVVNFMPDPVAGLTEMARVTRNGGWVGATVWDLAGNRAPMAAAWSAITEVDPSHPGEAHLPGGARGQLQELVERAGLSQVEGAELAVTLTHPTFEEWWEPYLHGVGPVGAALESLDQERRARVRVLCREQLGDGPFEIVAVAFAARGRSESHES